MAKRCINQGEFDAAQEHIRQAIAADSSKPEAFNLLGVLLEMSDDRLGAQKQYRAALALDPTYKPADENLNRAVGLGFAGSIKLGEHKKAPEERS
jgi:lipoprotein NlpI